MQRFCRVFLFVSTLTVIGTIQSPAEDRLRDLQEAAAASGKANWGHWGNRPKQYSAWTNHSSRLIPLYTFGVSLDSLRQQGSVYRDAKKLADLYTRPVDEVVNPQAEYFDQTDVFRLQEEAVANGKKYIILMVFDGMDWQTTQAAAIYQSKQVEYEFGHGTGLAFLDYIAPVTDYGYFVTSPISAEPKVDVDSQRVMSEIPPPRAYDARLGGETPWAIPARPEYLLGTDRDNPAPVPDSAVTAMAMTTGIKSFNGAINVDISGKHVVPIARTLQERGMSVGVVTSVPFSHATPACAYSNNVSRDDYQDLSRDLLGLPSVSNRVPLPGAEVVIGCGWGETKDADADQGRNFIPGNRYLIDEDLQRVDVRHGGKYVVAQRTAGRTGAEVLQEAVDQAVQQNHRLFGFFGVKKGHLPFRTADGDFNPANDVAKAEVYSPEDVQENPTLADCATSALNVLQHNQHGFWLMVEAGDVDWANHANNIDNSIGAVLSGDAAFEAIVRWVERNNAWHETALLVTADHGHYFNLIRPEVLTE